jgi:HEPN domain-containing protein/predicted nucleotidyltransferase
MAGEGRTQRALHLQAELQRLRLLLAEQPTVQQVIVFGSTATGQTHEWSDLDVMVIEESDAPFIERGLRLARLFRPQVGTQFLVYTPQEICALTRKPFIQVEVLGKGKVLSMHPHLDAQRWLTFAEQDLRMAELALRAEIFNQTCFHAQQCVEKCLKACLTAGGELLPRTHLIADLLPQLPAAAQGAIASLEQELLVLDQFYIPTRYPDALPGTLPEGLPQQPHAAAALATARRCYEEINRWIVELAGDG